MSKYLLRLWQRVVVIVVTSTVPLLFIAFLLINSSVTKEINFTRQELVGNAFQRPLEQLLDYLPRYGAARREALAGNDNARREAVQLEQQIDVALSRLAASYRGAPGVALKFSHEELAAHGRGNAELAVVLGDWERFKGGGSNDTELVVCGRMMEEVRAMIVHTGDLSNLILDNDLDSYYLVEITVAALPETQQRLGEAIELAEVVLRDSQGMQRGRLGAMAALLSEGNARIGHDAQTSLAEDTKFHGVSDSLQANLPPAVARFAAANQEFVRLLEEAANGGKVSVEEVMAAGWGARAQSFRLWETTADELDRLLNQRLKEIQAKRQNDVLAMFGTLGLVAVVVGLIMRSLLSVQRAQEQRAEAELRREQDFSRMVIEASPAFFVVIKVDGKILLMNQSMLKTLGYTLEEVLERDYLTMFVSEGERQMMKSAFLTIIHEQGPLTVENHVVSKGGRELLVEWHGRPIVEGGTVRHFICIGIDISERKRAELELVRMKNYLGNVIDSMPAAIVAMDSKDTVTQWNAGAAELSGVREAEAIGKPVAEVLPKFANAIEILQERARGNGVASKESLALMENGERELYNLMLYRLVANCMQGAVLRIENVTEQSRTQEVLIQTEKMMSLGGLAAGMAHEINNPLGIISQASQNIERRMQTELPANQRVAAEVGLSLEGMKAYYERREIPVFTKDIREAVARAAKIVNNMLQFSRKSASERQPTPLGELMDRTLELAGNDYDLRKQFDFRSIQIVRDYQPDLPPVPVVVVELQQVLLNLFKNAAQAMSEHKADRKPTIYLRLKREADFAVMEVADNGPGMEEKVARRVFEPFFTTKRPGVGTGLGLSVSYMIITQSHRGFIQLETSPGNGAKFIVKLPITL